MLHAVEVALLESSVRKMYRDTKSLPPRETSLTISPLLSLHVSVRIDLCSKLRRQ
jgi:hypothetical protein